jgi:hypothetical protein
MSFVKEIDIFRFYEGASPKQITFNAPILNKQLKQLINNDINIYNDILYLDGILTTLDIHRPKEELNNIIEPRVPNNSYDLREYLRDFGTIKCWNKE